MRQILWSGEKLFGVFSATAEGLDSHAHQLSEEIQHHSVLHWWRFLLDTGWVSFVTAGYACIFIYLVTPE